nr:MAG TPA: hypothetical protein [Caudoviricetes sp.]
MVWAYCTDNTFPLCSVVVVNYYAFYLRTAAAFTAEQTISPLLRKQQRSPFLAH